MTKQKDEKLPSTIELTDSQAPLISQKDTSNPQHHTWLSLQGGSYNHVWRSNFDSPQALVPGESYQGPWVLKYAIPSKDPVSNAMNNKHRAVRLWNEINPKLPKAGLYKRGWVAPYLENSRPATDDEIAQKLVEIFRDTRRITVDAATKGNFITLKDTGEVVLVDMDLALKRRTSLASIDFAKNLNTRFATYWIDPQLHLSMPKTLEVTRNLLYLEDSLDDNEMDILCQDSKISLKNIQALTWFRTNKVKLTYNLFHQISVLNDSDVPLSETLLEALSVYSQKSVIDPEIESPRKRGLRYEFFYPEPRKRNHFDDELPEAQARLS
ncbi:Uncharacterised protein [Legionella lansingensis]|uniref:Uncharacterized protein n=1 Tax=Legionella lansingensis TaxID=45067 RepID=A0A0W0VPP3_9GAMM|nr:hypothetical protein [Legionella lansingensis]KTD22100.1 hypothetical protein Llan_1363 [Legionella lansingensis]SNV45801.1 Uncharacterised protein [Legionella lansingensis]